MAEPLSAFDMARVRWGWGTSSDPAQRQRFAEAGLSPLTSEERMRMERGWGAAPLASKESREAMVAEEVRRGDRPAYQLPEAYGGRPEGTTRRAIRMQKAWDAEQAARIQQEQEMRQQAEFNRQMEIRNREDIRAQAKYEREIEEYRAQQKADAEAEIQGTRIVSALGELDPRSPDFLDKFKDISRENRLGLELPDVQNVVKTYVTINDIYRKQDEEAIADDINRKATRDQQLAQLTKLAKLTGRNLSDLAVSDMQTEELIVDPVAVGEAEAELARKPTREITDPAASVLRQEAKELRSSIRDIDLNIVTAQTELRAATNDKTRAAAETRLAELMTQRQLLDTDRQGVEAALAGAGQETPAPAVQKPTNAQIESARKAATDQNQSPALRNAARRFLEDNGIEVEAEEPTQQEDQPQINLAPVPTPPPAAGAPPQAMEEPTIESVAPEALKQEIQDEQSLREERDKLYKMGYRFSSNKRQRELYGSVSKQLEKARENKNKIKYRTVSEIRKRMKEIGPFNPSPELRREYIRLQQEREVLLGA